MKIKRFKFSKRTGESDLPSPVVGVGSKVKRAGGNRYALVGIVILFGAFGTVTVLKNFADSSPTPASITEAQARLVKMHGLGAIPPPKSAYIRAVQPRANIQQALPASVDLTPWAPPVGNQGNVNSCAAWAVDHSLFGWYVKKDGYPTSLQAPMYTYAQIVRGQNIPTSPEQNFSVAELQGIDTEADYYQGDNDYTSQPNGEEISNASHYEINSSSTIFIGPQPGNAPQLLLEQQLASGNPAVIMISVYPEFDDANSTDSLVGTPAPGEVSRGYHEITALGYNSQGLVIENQWGTGWGNNGYATLSWAFVNSYVIEADDISGIHVTQSGTGNLAATSNSAISKSGSLNTYLGLAPGTSPSMTYLPNSNETAFHAANGDLWLAGRSGTQDTFLGMAPGTSPSITATGSSYEVAFHAANGYLWTMGYGGTKDWELGLQAGTNPSITGLWSGGVEIAFNAFGTGHLWVAGNAGTLDTGLGMYPNTSPSITAIGSSYEVAFHAANGDLWTAGYGGGKDWRLGMEPVTSPSIITLTGGGVQMAFNALGSGVLWTAGSDGTIDSNLGTAIWSSPSIIATPSNGYDIDYSD